MAHAKRGAYELGWGLRALEVVKRGWWELTFVLTSWAVIVESRRLRISVKWGRSSKTSSVSYQVEEFLKMGMFD